MNQSVQRWSRVVAFGLAVLGLAVAVAPAAHAQQASGIAGVVRDSAGLAMPGVTADRVNVLQEPGVLIIRGERPLPFAGSRLVLRQLEIPYGAFERRISLPGAHLDAGVPELSQGLLVLRMRKTG